ncbi:hypothetical protein ABZ208_37540 [Streptomyces sp. NPDC006208]|uniref:hypothetical protein n=1 Tax=Streptomyces sp. NPDC006208 TaxID=3156734 RepID=UPI0033B6BA29
MARYSGNLLRMQAPAEPTIAPGGPDPSHSQPSGPTEVPEYRAEEITVSPETGIDYAGLRLSDGIPEAIVAGQPGVGWNAPDSAMVPPGSGGTPARNVPAWTRGDPHNASVDTSHARNRGATPLPPNHDGNDSGPYTYTNPMVGVEGTSFLERRIGFPEEIWAEPTGGGADKFVAGTNSYRSSNPEGDNYLHRGDARVHYGFEGNWFVHTPMFQDKPAQTYERRTPPITSTDPLVGGRYDRTPAMGQLAANPWLSELGESPTPTGYGVAVDGVM